jgi:hypothetical protein
VENVQLTLKIIVAYDNQDEVLGSYFTACKDDILGFLLEQKENGFPLEIVEIIESANCHPAYIDLRLSDYQDEPLLVIAYSHGLPHSIRCNNVGYIHSDNVHLFYNSYFSTNACSSAKELGVSFAGKQGVFIGFDKEVRAFKRESGMMETSVKCDNCGLKYAIANPLMTITETFKAIKSYYNMVIDEGDDFQVNVFTLTELRKTRDALKIYGNENFRMQDYLNITLVE